MSRRGPVVVVDLDSTLADTRHRRSLAPSENRDLMESWLPYSMACSDDAAIPGMVRLVRLLDAGGALIFLLSARCGEAQVLTEDWLWKVDVPYDRLRLRGAHEGAGSPSDWKVDVLLHWREQGWNLSLFIDDWAETCRAVEAIGIPTLTPAFLAGDYKPGH